MVLLVHFFTRVDYVENVDTIIKLIQWIKHAVTHGSAKSMGSAVSWILDGLLKPISYTPRRSCSDLIKNTTQIILSYDNNNSHWQ